MANSTYRAGLDAAGLVDILIESARAGHHRLQSCSPTEGERCGSYHPYRAQCANVKGYVAQRWVEAHRQDLISYVHLLMLADTVDKEVKI